MQDTKYDYFILGQGLAGSIIAKKLLQYNCKVLVFDNQHRHSSSTIAAGIINPVTGHRINITDNFAQYHSLAKRFYQELEQQFKQQFWIEIDQIRLLKNPGQASYWHKRKKEACYNDYLGERLDNHPLFKSSGEGAGNGIAEIKQTNFIAVKPLLETLREYLIEKQALLADNIDYTQIKFSDDHVEVKGQSAKNIIFCEGHQATHNPWLEHLPFKLAKGEILTLSNSQQVNTMLNWGNWLLPNQNGQLRLGSNFDWQDISPDTKPETRLHLLQSLNKFTTIKEQVLDHQAGIRPSTLQRKPFIGRLSTQRNAISFNGFGSKGCLLMPYYAEQLCQHILHQAPLSAEVTQWL